MSGYRKGDKIAEFYKIEAELGRGSYAVVKLGVNRKTGARVAIKIIEK
jgi:serine/threonine protein kinase